MLLRFGRSARRFGQGCFLAKIGPRASRKYVIRGGGPRARRRSSGVGCPCPRLGSGEAWSSPSNGPIPDLVAPIRPLQLYADGGYQLRIRSLEGTPNYGPRHYDMWFHVLLWYVVSLIIMVVSHVIITGITNKWKLNEIINDILCFYGSNIFEDVIWTYVTHTPNFVNFWDYFCIINFFFAENHQNAFKSIKYYSIDQKL
jgi:hypothetical protein